MRLKKGAIGLRFPPCPDPELRGAAPASFDVRLLDYAHDNDNRSLERRSVMRLLAATLIAGLAVGLCAGADDTAGTKNLKPAQAFKEWADYFVGGVWTTTNAKGQREESRWEWILDKS